MAAMSIVYLIPSALAENANQAILPYTVDAVKDCQVFFVENERSARRFLKSIWKEMVIDNYEWLAIHKAEDSVKNDFIKYIRQGKNIGIISEAGCPGVADPGQALIQAAHKEKAIVKPIVGPSSVLLALMASGLNGQQFRFNGYLPIDNIEKIKAIKQLEQSSLKNNCTEIFIETPYRNNQMLETLLKTCQPSTLISIAADLTAENEWIKTAPVSEWKKDIPQLHKRQVVFSLLSR
ncbi:MAG: SAM-dependent methyltransferase [Chitinophagaceae bacterium]|nr:SAM-dependent methyltransferase [Chitinophagaceae bacterium]